MSLLAPFTAALIGAGAGMMLEDGRRARVIAPLAIAAGIVTELVVLGELDGLLGWARWLVLIVGVATAVALALALSRRTRAVIVAVALAALLAAPATWATETLGHAASATFPTGRPRGGGADRQRQRWRPGRRVRGAGGVGRAFRGGRGAGAAPGGGAGGFAPPAGGFGGGARRRAAVRAAAPRAAAQAADPPRAAPAGPGCSAAWTRR